MLKLSKLYSEMIFQQGFVHSDPHPGNILMRCTKGTKDREKLEIVMLDHGLYNVSLPFPLLPSPNPPYPLPSLPPSPSHCQELSDKFRVNYCKLWQALINEDQAAIKHYCMELHAGSLYKLLACMVTARAWAKIERGITNSGRSVEEVRKGRGKGEWQQWGLGGGGDIHPQT